MDLFKIKINKIEYIYKLKYKFLEFIIKWLLRYYTVIFAIFGRKCECVVEWGTRLSGKIRYN